MGTSWSIAVAAVFVWLGMVLAISFLEAPLKFQAPGVSLQIGLGIGRLVFRALNICESVLALVIAMALFRIASTDWVVIGFGVAVGALLIQVLAVRPALSRRTAAVLAGAEGPRSTAHYVYIACELVKVVALGVAGTGLLSG